MRATIGRRRVDKLPLVLRSSVQTIVTRSQCVNQYDTSSSTACPGALVLGNWQVSGSGAFQMPLYLFDLTSHINNVSGTLFKANPLWQMQQSTAGVVTFNQITSTAYSVPTGQNPQWVVESSSAPVAGTGTAPNACDLLASVDIDLLFYGSVTRPTKFSVSLITLKEDWLHPDTIANDSTGTVNGLNYYADANAFWQGIVRPDLFNPLLKGSPRGTRGKMHTLARRAWETQARLTNEPSATTYAGHQTRLRMRWNANRLQRYDWQDNSALASMANQEAADYQVDQNSPTIQVEPKRRVYLMIHAQATAYYGSTPDPGYMASFDFVIRKRNQLVV